MLWESLEEWFLIPRREIHSILISAQGAAISLVLLWKPAIFSSKYVARIPKWPKSITSFWPKHLQNHAHPLGRTYLYSPYKEVAPPRARAFRSSSLSEKSQSDCALWREAGRLYFLIVFIFSGAYCSYWYTTLRWTNTCRPMWDYLLFTSNCHHSLP